MADREVEVCRIIGKRTPYRPANPDVTFAQISVSPSRVEVAVFPDPSRELRTSCGVWEHTEHELECLAAALRLAAQAPFPPEIEADCPESRIGLKLSIWNCAILPVGARLDTEPESVAASQDPRAKFLCSSGPSPLTRQHLVRLGVILLNDHSEVIITPDGALRLANWLEAQLRRIRPAT